MDAALRTGCDVSCRAGTVIFRLQVDVKNSPGLGEVVLDLLQAEVLRFRNREVDNWNGQDEDGREEVERSVEGEAELEDGEELEAEDQEDAGKAPGQAFAESSNFRWEKFT